MTPKLRSYQQCRWYAFIYRVNMILFVKLASLFCECKNCTLFCCPNAFQVVSDTVPLEYYYIGLSRYRRRPILRVFVWQRTKLYVSKVSLWSWSFKFRASKEIYATVCVTFAGESRANKFHSKWQLWWVLDPLKQKNMISSLSIYLNRYMNV